MKFLPIGTVLILAAGVSANPVNSLLQACEDQPIQRHKSLTIWPESPVHNTSRCGPGSARKSERDPLPAQNAC